MAPTRGLSIIIIMLPNQAIASTPSWIVHGDSLDCQQGIIARTILSHGETYLGSDSSLFHTGNVRVLVTNPLPQLQASCCRGQSLLLATSTTACMQRRADCKQRLHALRSTVTSS
jgi:hypothetical protein